MSAQVTSEAGAAGAPRHRVALLSTATLSQFGASILQQGTVVLGVFFASTYHLSLGQMGLVIAAMTFGLMFSGIGAGPAVDVWGSRRVLFIGTLIIAAAATAIAVSPSLSMTVALLFVTGLALGTVPLSGTKAIMLAWPRERRGMPTGIRQMGVPLGALVTALALPTLATHLGLKPIYAGFAVIVVLSGLTFCAVLPAQTTRPSRQQTRFAPGEARRILVPAICGFLLAWGQYALLTYTIPMLQQDGVSVAVGGELLALAQVGGAAARFGLGAISDRFFGGRREHALLGSAVAGAAFAVILAMLPHHFPVLGLAALWLLFGGAFVGWNALALTWAGERIAEARVGSAIGLETSAVLTGASVSTPIFGAIVERTGAYQPAWLTLAAVLTVAAALLWAQARKPELALDEPVVAEIIAESQVI